MFLICVTPTRPWALLTGHTEGYCRQTPPLKNHEAEHTQGVNKKSSTPWWSSYSLLLRACSVLLLRNRLWGPATKLIAQLPAKLSISRPILLQSISRTASNFSSAARMLPQPTWNLLATIGWPRTTHHLREWMASADFPTFAILPHKLVYFSPWYDRVAQSAIRCVLR